MVCWYSWDDCQQAVSKTTPGRCQNTTSRTYQRQRELHRLRRTRRRRHAGQQCSLVIARCSCGRAMCGARVAMVFAVFTTVPFRHFCETHPARVAKSRVHLRGWPDACRFGRRHRPEGACPCIKMPPVLGNDIVSCKFEQTGFPRNTQFLFKRSKRDQEQAPFTTPTTTKHHQTSQWLATTLSRSSTPRWRIPPRCVSRPLPADLTRSIPPPRNPLLTAAAGCPEARARPVRGRQGQVLGAPGQPGAGADEPAGADGGQQGGAEGACAGAEQEQLDSLDG